VDIFSGVQASRGNIETTVNIPGQNLSFANSQTQREPTQGRAIDHIGFEVDDLEPFIQRLEARGIEFQLGYTVIDSIELAIAFFVDPSGVRIELTEGFDEYYP
jgi:catechol 2,3-dioxygenase-like lactoylglutathione lyase family enzyme